MKKLQLFSGKIPVEILREAIRSAIENGLLTKWKAEMKQWADSGVIPERTGKLRKSFKSMVDRSTSDLLKVGSDLRYAKYANRRSGFIQLAAKHGISIVRKLIVKSLQERGVDAK